MTTTAAIQQPDDEEIKDPYPFKLVRIVDGKIIPQDASKTADRLINNLEALKAKKQKLPGRYVVVHTTLLVVAK